MWVVPFLRSTCAFLHEKYCTSSPTLCIGLCRLRRSDTTPTETKHLRILASYSSAMDYVFSLSRAVIGVAKRTSTTHPVARYACLEHTIALLRTWLLCIGTETHRRRWRGSDISSERNWRVELSFCCRVLEPIIAQGRFAQCRLLASYALGLVYALQGCRVVSAHIALPTPTADPPFPSYTQVAFVAVDVDAESRRHGDCWRDLRRVG